MSYQTKQISFYGIPITILLQQNNGPCPLLAIINSLALQQLVQIPPRPEQSNDQVVEILTDRLFEMQLDDPIKIIKRIQSLDQGLIVTPRFSGDMFNESHVIELFNVFGLGVVHGWLVGLFPNPQVDPQDTEAYRVLAGRGDYNSVIDLVVQFDSKRQKGKGVDYGVIDSNSPDLEHESLVAKNWLDANPNQLTYFGITTLMDMIKLDQASPLFLTADQGFSGQEGIVWESLIDAHGDSVFLDSFFNRSVIEEVHIPQVVNDDSDADLAIAISLQQQEELRVQQLVEPQIVDDGRSKKKQKNKCIVM